MLSSTLLTLLVVPVFYLVLDDFADWLKRRGRLKRAGSPAGVAHPTPRRVRG